MNQRPRRSAILFLCGVNAVVMGIMVSAVFGEEVPRTTLHGQSSFVVSTPQVEVAITELGGHMAPVTFYRDGASPVNPYYVSPWQDESPKAMPVPVLVPLRGDFFCMPFGGNDQTLGAEKHPPHGETAGSKWTAVGIKNAGDVTTLTLSLETHIRKGRVTKEVSLVNGENVIYTKHTIEGFAGPAPLGHHATLAMPDDEGAAHLAASPFKFGMTYPGKFSDPKQREYQALLPGAKWTSLTQVPVAWKGEPDADLTRLPARVGFADLIQLVNEPWEKTSGPAWMTATFPSSGFLWFSLKDPAVLTSTVFWIENHGRHGHPWNGRNNCLGLEDVTAYFADGLVPSSKPNALTEAGVKTALELSERQPTSVNYIQGVVKIPQGFDQVKAVEYGSHTATFVSTTGQKVTVPVRHEFIKAGKF